MTEKMLPYFVFNHFQLGPITIYTWGFFVGLGFLAGYLWVLWEARKKGISSDKIAFLTLAIFLGAALGARLFFLLQAPKVFLNDISLFWRFNGGMMIWGGILGGIVFGWLFWVCFPLCKGGLRGILGTQEINPPARGLATSFTKGGINPPRPSFLKEGGKKMDFWHLADIFAPAAALGIAIGRLGCFLINDHQGAPTNLPWGILWPDGVARHPVALYEILAMIILFFALLWWRKRQEEAVIPAEEPGSRILDSRFRSPCRSLRRSAGGNDRKDEIDKSGGSLFLIFLIGYSLIRFFLD